MHEGRGVADAIILLLEDGHKDIPGFSNYSKDAKGRWWVLLRMESVGVNVASRTLSA